MHWITGFFDTLILLGAIQGFIVSGLLRRRSRSSSVISTGPSSTASGHSFPVISSAGPFNSDPSNPNPAVPSDPTALSDPGRLSRRLLSTLIFLLALACLDLFLTKQPWVTQTTTGAVLSAIIPMIIVMPIGPLIYFYIRSCLDPAFRMGRRERRHFFPIVIDFFPQALAILYIIGLLTGILRKQYNLGTFIDEYDTWSDIPRWISLVTYLWLSARYIAKQRSHAGHLIATRNHDHAGHLIQNNLIATLKDGEAAQNSTPPDAFAWPGKLVRIFIIFSAVWLIFLLPYEIPRYSNWLLGTLDWYPIYLPIVFMIYWLGVKGYFISYQSTLFSTDTTVSSIDGTVPSTHMPASSTDTPASSADTTAPPSERTIRTSLQQDAVDQTMAALIKSMEEDKLWLNPELNLPMLARHSNIASKTLSAVLNQHMSKTFNEFVNEYRVQEVKKRLLLPESRALTIAGLAYECGFNSLPTFQRAFKSMIGQSPKEFLSIHAAMGK